MKNEIFQIRNTVGMASLTKLLETVEVGISKQSERWFAILH